MEKTMLRLTSQTHCEVLEADHDDPSKGFFDDGQKTEISFSADGDFGEIKKTETPLKRRSRAHKKVKSSQVAYMIQPTPRKGYSAVLLPLPSELEPETISWICSCHGDSH